MFKITSVRAIEWPNFSLRKGENVFTTRKAVPPTLWSKLDRFRALGLVDFEGKAEAGPGDALPKLDELSQKQLYAMSKDELGELAKASGVSVVEGASKAALLAALQPKPAAPAPAAEPVAPGEPEPVVVAPRRKS